MKYSEARFFIKSGDILLYRGKTALSRFICRMTGGSWSHVGVAYWVQDRLFIFQQEEFKNCNLQLLSETVPFDWVEMGLTIPADFEHWMYSQLNHPYSYWDAFMVGIGLRGHDAHGICSEMATDVLDRLGKHYPECRESPASLAAALLDDGHILRSVLPD